MNKKRSIKGVVIFFCLFPMVLIGAEIMAEVYFRMQGFVEKTILQRTIIGIALIIGITICIVGFIVVQYFNKMIKSIRGIMNVLEYASKGDLTHTVDIKATKRNDEIGEIARGVGILSNSLSGLITKLDTSADVLKKNAVYLNTSAKEVGINVDNISNAVNDIAKSVSAQSEDTNSVAREIENISKRIEDTLAAIIKLDNNVGNMKQMSDNGVESSKELRAISEDVEKQVQEVMTQTQRTNDSANLIQNVTNMIVAIASQTNLLALNASIEAARAGESGKGFAVVAGEIKTLAEESNNSAKKIAEIIEELRMNSDKSVDIMNEVYKVIEVQGEKIKQTKQVFNQVNEGLEISIQNIHEIAENTKQLENAKNEVVISVEHLSGISEENSASTEETAASTEEMTAMVQELMSQSANLKEVSEELDIEINNFIVK